MYAGGRKVESETGWSRRTRDLDVNTPHPLRTSTMLLQVPYPTVREDYNGRPAVRKGPVTCAEYCFHR